MFGYQPFTDLVDYLAFIFEVVGAVYIAYGGLRAAFCLLLLETRLRDISYDSIRQGLARKLIFGLEFLIAADVLQTLVDPTQEEVLILGGIVAIRVVLGHFLTEESKETLE